MPPTQPTPAPPAGPLTRWLRNPGATETRWLHHLLHHLAGAAHQLVPLTVALVALVLTYLVIGEAIQAGWARHGRWVAIAPPAEPDPAGGLALWRMLHPLLTARRSLAGRRPPVAFECHADATGLRIGLWVSPTVSAAGVARAVEAAWPGARAAITTPPKLPPAGRVSGGQARLAGPDWFPLSVDQAGGDPIRGLLSTLVGDDTGQASVVAVLARPAAGRRIARARRAARAIRRGQPTSATGRALDLLHNRSTVGRPSAYADPLALGDVREITAKVAAAPHFEVAIRYAVTGSAGRDGRRRRRARLRQISAALGLYTGRNHLVGHHLGRPAGALAGRRLRRGFLASAPELAALAHLPAEPAGYGLPAAPARTVAPPPEVAHA
jgi:hypothetical protein